MGKFIPKRRARRSWVTPAACGAPGERDSSGGVSTACLPTLGLSCLCSPGTDEAQRDELPRRHFSRARVLLSLSLRRGPSPGLCAQPAAGRSPARPGSCRRPHRRGVSEPPACRPGRAPGPSAARWAGGLLPCGGQVGTGCSAARTQSAAAEARPWPGSSEAAGALRSGSVQLTPARRASGRGAPGPPAPGSRLTRRFCLRLSSGKPPGPAGLEASGAGPSNRSPVGMGLATVFSKKLGACSSGPCRTQPHGGPPKP